MTDDEDKGFDPAWYGVAGMVVWAALSCYLMFELYRAHAILEECIPHGDRCCDYYECESGCTAEKKP